MLSIYLKKPNRMLSLSLSPSLSLSLSPTGVVWIPVRLGNAETNLYEKKQNKNNHNNGQHTFETSNRHTYRTFLWLYDSSQHCHHVVPAAASNDLGLQPKTAHQNRSGPPKTNGISKLMPVAMFSWCRVPFWGLR